MLSAALAPDADAFRGIARMAKGRNAARADPFTAAMVLLFLWFYNLFWGAKVTVQMRVLSAPTFFSIKK
jgi:hypothetical protein